MIPMIAIIAVRPRPRPSFRYWIPLPLFLLWILLLPFVVLLLPVAFVACLVLEISFFKAISAGWQLLCGLRSTTVEVDHRQASVSIRFH